MHLKNTKNRIKCIFYHDFKKEEGDMQWQDGAGHVKMGGESIPAGGNKVQRPYGREEFELLIFIALCTITTMKC